MENKPKLTVSGYRGIWGDSLTKPIVRNFTEAFIEFIKENTTETTTILIGRDGRESGPEIKEVVMDVLNKKGVKFIDGDILPTPTVLFAVKKHKYDGAIIITASHNPREYNGLKFVTSKALFTDENEVEKIKANFNNIRNKEISYPLDIIENKIDPNNEYNLKKEHVDQILQNINVGIIREKKWRVAVDMIARSKTLIL